MCRSLFVISHVDHFPIAPDDPDFDIQLRIDHYLREKADRTSFLPTASRVLEGVNGPEERQKWLFPLLRRAEWLLDHPELGAPHWSAHLLATVNLLLNHQAPAGDEQFIGLLAHAGVFCRAQEWDAPGQFLPQVVRRLATRDGCEALWPAAQSAWLEFEKCDQPRAGRWAAMLGLALLRAGHPPSADRCFSAAITFGQRSPWKAFFALADTRLVDPLEPAPAKVAAAVRKFPPGEFANRFAEWTAGCDTGVLSWYGVATLKILLHGAAIERVDTTRLTRVAWRDPARAALILPLLAAPAAAPAAILNDRQALLALLDSDQAPLDRTTELLGEAVAREGWDAELVNRVTAWRDSLHGSVSMQNVRQRVDWLLWFENIKPIDPKVCWSAVVRQHLRDTAADDRWQRLLEPTSFALTDRPPAKWLKQIGPLLSALGDDEFAHRFHAWTRPLSSGQPQALEPAGRDVLRNLFWLAAIVQHPLVDEALAAFAGAQWKNKKVAGYANKLIGPYVYAVTQRSSGFAKRCLAPLVERGLIPADSKHLAACREAGIDVPEAPATVAADPETLILTQTLRNCGCTLRGEEVVVVGEHETYLVHQKTQQIRRERDGTRLEFVLDPDEGPEAELLDHALNRGAFGNGLLVLVAALQRDSLTGHYLRPAASCSHERSGEPT